MNLKLSEIPPCVAVCPGDDIPMAPNDTDLQLKYIIPRTQPQTKINYTDYLRDNKKGLFAGDRLVYQCLTRSWGVYGGVDLVHDSFRCKDDGEYDAPGPDDIWPSCSPQQSSKYSVRLQQG